MDPTTLDPAARPEASTRYAADGYLALRGLFDGAEVAAWRDECDRVFSIPGVVRKGNLRTRSRPSESGQPVIDRLDPVTDMSPVLRRLADDPRALEAAAIALGQRPVLFKDKLITKPPGTHGYGVHQDYMRWQFLPVPPEGVATVAVAFDPASAQSGAVEVFRDQHSRLLTPPGIVADPAEEDLDMGAVEPVSLQPGDVLL
ncbi:MAG TPA: phytanoyl-CoA dioxygenase family protein, partial [Acidimicrobiales bacterium]|nr:phytanoyl-CoA dioxygenase family protein [Acidimicrobiales bacterium]